MLRTKQKGAVQSPLFGHIGWIRVIRILPRLLPPPKASSKLGQQGGLTLMWGVGDERASLFLRGL